VPVSTYRQQRRGGKGVIGMDTKDEDYVEHVFTARPTTTCCSSPSRAACTGRRSTSARGGRASRGKAIVNLLEISGDEKIAAMIRVREFPETHLVFATERASSRRPTSPRSATRAPAASSPSTSRRATG
jgi:DNA gyrase subunit A